MLPYYYIIIFLKERERVHIDSYNPSFQLSAYNPVKGVVFGVLSILLSKHAVVEMSILISRQILAFSF